MKHLLKIADLSKREILDILGLADQLKFENKNGIAHHRLKGKTLGMIFAKASTRTRVSFEVGMFELGGQALFLSANDLQIGRGEPIEDTARVLSRYIHGIMIRTFDQADVEGLAKHGTVPVINGLTDYAHPCQVLADFMTIREVKGHLEGIKMAYIGDGNNMANSLIAGCVALGINLTLACPGGYLPNATLLEKGKALGLVCLNSDAKQAVSGADVVYTDVWASMGQEGEKVARQIAFEGYQVNSELMGHAKPDAIVLHCLPAHRGEEISADVMEKYASVIFTQAENRLHAQKAVMVKLMENK